MVSRSQALAEQHDCRASARKIEATLERPYHFVESGLPNVYLVGIDYFFCDECEKQSANIPFAKDLMVKIASAIVRKEAPLDHNEIRFLRKRLGKKSSEFARIIGLTPEHISRLESNNEKYSASESVDKFIRVYYSLMSGDATLKDIMNRHIDEYIASLHGEDHLTRVCAELHDHEWEAEAVPA